MKKKLIINFLAILALLALPSKIFAQVTLGPTASKFVLFTTSGAIDDNASALSHITGNVGTNTPGSITDFGNVDGIMHDGADLETAAVDADLLSIIGQINLLPATLVGPLSLGSGGSITPGVWSIPGNATITLDLFIDALGDPDAQFIIKVAGTMSMNTLSRVKLINGAKACNIFWKIDLAVTMASLSTMRGNIITGGAVVMGSGDSLEGRIFSTPAGAITIDGITAFTPLGCGSPILTGPNSPPLGSLECYTIFSSDGALNGNLSTTSIGDVGNAGGGSVTGWTAGNVTGMLHPTGDPSTMLAATDLTMLYNTLNAMVPDIELLYPVLLGSNLVLTPHVYLINSSINGPAFLTDTLVLNAQGNANAVFAFQIINGAFSTTVASYIKLINGAQAKNVYWMVDGAVSINNNSTFRGTIVISSGALNMVNTNVTLDGRAFTQVGAITTSGCAATMTPGCGGFDIITDPSDSTVCAGSGVSFTVIASNATNYQWAENTGSGFVDVPNSPPYSGVTSATLIINPVTMSMHNYTYQCTVTGTSGNITSNYATLRVNPSGTISGTTPNSRCGTGTVTLGATAGAGTINWYAGLAGGSSLGTGPSYTTPIISVTDTFYVSAIVGTCPSSPRSMVIATVNPIPTITGTTPNSRCGTGTVVLGTTSSAGTINWYAALTGGASLGSGISYTTPIISVTDTFYVDATLVGCTTASRSMVIATINPIPTITGTTPGSRCGTGTVVLGTTSSAGTINWYADLTGGASLGTGISFTTPIISVTDTFYVDATLVGCTTASRSMVIATINPIPTITGTTPGSRCGTGTVVLGTTSSGGTINWYADLTGGASLGTGISFTTPILSVTDTFYVDATLGICTTTSRSMVIATVNQTPSITGTTPNTRCGTGTVTLGAASSGGVIDWYADLVGGSSLGTGISFTTPIISVTDTFYVDATTGSCTTGSRTMVIATVNQAPEAAATGTSPVCSEDSINLTSSFVNGGTYEWTGPNGYTSTTQNNTIPDAGSEHSGVYSLIVTANGCASEASTVAVLVIICDIDLGVVKTVNISKPQIGTEVIFTITATNHGTENATGVLVTDMLQSGYSYVSSSASIGLYNSANGIWTIGTLEGGSSATLIITAIVNIEGTYVNTATINGNEDDANSANDVSVVETFPTDFFIPEGFSPNADAINDVFFIRGLDHLPNNSITVFNRWGDKVYDASPYTNTWDGTCTTGVQIGGSELPVSTYYYLFNKGDGSKMIKGTIYLNR